MNIEQVLTRPSASPLGSRSVVVQQRRRALIGTLVVFGSVALVGCSTAVTSGSGPDGASAAATTSAPTTTSAPPTTEAPATTEAPTTTEVTLPPETTEATTTLPPPTTVPANLVAPLVEPLRAVGAGGGAETARVQMRLLELGFWLSGADGGYGLTTKQAVMAFQKYMALDASGKVDQATADALSAMTMRPARARQFRHARRGRQVQAVAVLRDRRQDRLDPQHLHRQRRGVHGRGQEHARRTITGVSLTPDGLHEVNRERPEGWWEGDLGEIYRPKYFVGGVAVHGSNSIPNYPASHGCVRVSVPAMDWIWDSGIMPLRTPVWVHGG